MEQPTMRRLARAGAIGLLIGGLGALLALTPPGVGLEERFGLSWLFWVRGPLEPPADAVVVSLDRESAEQLRLPEKISDWPRELHARLIERLAAAGASVIVFDVMFNRPREPAQDRALAQAIADAGQVILFEQLHEDFRLLPAGDGAVAGLLATKQWRPPLPALVAAAVGTAPFPLPRTTDQVSQFWAFTSGLGERPTLPVVAMQQYAMPVLADWARLLRAAGVPVGEGDLVLEPEHLARPGVLPAAMRALRLAFAADASLGARLRADLARERLDEGARRLLAAMIGLYDGPDSRYLNFYGPARRVPTIPLHRLLGADFGKLAPDLAGKAVFVGQSEMINASDDGFITVFAGPKNARIGGVEIAATAFANLLDDHLLQLAGLAPTLLWVGSFGLIVSLIAGLLPAMLALPLTLAFVAAWYLGAQAAFTRAAFWLPLTIPLLLQLPLGLFAGLLLQYRDARRARANIHRGMRYYLPERIAAGFAEAPLDPGALKESLFTACLISDSQGFTALGETMTPEALSALLDRYFAILFGTVERHGGVVTDVKGDGMTCVWSAPQPDPGCCRRACLASLDMAREIADFNRAEPFALPIRIGLNAGFVMVGNVGGSGRFVYSVVGDCPNTASRLESLNKQLGTGILASDAVTADLPDVLFRPLGRFLVAGRSQPLGIAEVLGRAGDPHDAALLEGFAEALAAFQAQRWSAAVARLEALLAPHPGDGPARFYLERCRSYLAGAPLPPDPGVIHLDRK